MPVLREWLAIWFSRAVGAMDATTGALLMVIPATTVSLFGAALPQGDDIAIRFVGAFVCSVGLVYLWAACRACGDVRLSRIREVWGATAIIRTVIAVFVTIAVVFRRLELPWITIALTDAGVAALQIWWLKNWKRP